MTATTTSIGFLGFGQVGAAMAERLLAPDVRLYVFDARHEAMEPFVKRGATAYLEARVTRQERTSARLRRPGPSGAEKPEPWRSIARSVRPAAWDS